MEKTLKDIRKIVIETLDSHGFENPVEESKWLLAYVLEQDSSYITLTPEVLFPKESYGKLEEALKRRLNHEPLSRIRGTREFWSLEFNLNEYTLDPRPDSEILVEGVLQHTSSQEKLRILDLGTGTGCLLISLLKELPHAHGMGVDRAYGAIQMARHNARKHGVEDRTAFLQGHWSEALAGPFDVIVSNPPYIPYKDKETLAPEVTQYDPCLALYGGEDGYDCYRTLAQDLFRIIAPHGLIALELGHGQRCELQSIFQHMGYHVIDVLKDLQGIERVALLMYKAS